MKGSEPAGAACPFDNNVGNKFVMWKSLLKCNPRFPVWPGYDFENLGNLLKKLPYVIELNFMKVLFYK